ncbi:hypothetical protein SK128_008232 [Halocaridina rubra]|uniref:Mannosyltransferase n=1 Tax=Halocaridina rubra TaxID=373956 RepID=A0AAN9AE70_HALRR
MLPNFIALVYLGMVHQRGPLDTMTVLRQDIAKFESPNILFLMPCHSTPYYSHLHKNVSMRFLTCEPNLAYRGNYFDEADTFEKDPAAWLHQHYNPQGNGEGISKEHSDIILPSHLVLFDVLVSKIKDFLRNHKYHLKHRLFHAHIEDGRRVQAEHNRN